MLQLIQTISRTPHDRTKPSSINVKVLGQHSDHPNDIAASLQACEQFIEDLSFGDGEVGTLLDTLRRRVMITFVPTCGPGGEQADPDILFQKIYDGLDGEMGRFIVSFSVVRVV